ncbi:ADP-ribose pyrophosphatase, mitochondrial [Diachasmimorpha longicaudata]|uniref:ADP-ribose pyrophosphatase, mitochondrial n=1 Tax=Diachasmimorpha longicaudata TaxID=58733 RepID=UPI0030B9042F
MELSKVPLRNLSGVEWRHYICRNGFYGTTKVKRFPVPDWHTDWRNYKEVNPTDWPEYAPVEYTSRYIHGKPWADPDISDPSFKPEWNTKNELINRESYGRATECFKYIIGGDGRPRNPIGRTGITGRGVLGRWGPNHAVDTIVTRWKSSSGDEPVADEIIGEETAADVPDHRAKQAVEDKSKGGSKGQSPRKKDILQFIAIQRKDTMQWAIPGGMVEPTETISEALQREFKEEALNYDEEGRSPEQQALGGEMIDSDKKQGEIPGAVRGVNQSGYSVLLDKCHGLLLNSQGERCTINTGTPMTMAKLFRVGDIVYRGYVDDPRNTDNAWMETTAVNFHDNEASGFRYLPLVAGDEASKVEWIDVDASLDFYGEHRMLLRYVAILRNARWDAPFFYKG